MADLFLDTFPYNAHTTASDALWAGLPLISKQGESFSSRVASSILKAMDLPELIVNDDQGYINLAVDLALNEEKLKSIRKKIYEKRKSSALFNTPLLTKNLEDIYIKMLSR
jgi:predicted O-linked N-acetylglucosamine transferase (SPINDLY family)